MSLNDDELDSELRRLFGDDRLDLPARPDAGRAVLAGAKRIRRRRAMLTGSGGAVAVAAVLVAGITLTSGQNADQQPPSGLGGQTTMSTTAKPSPPKTTTTPSPPPATTPETSEPSATTPPETTSDTRSAGPGAEILAAPVPSDATLGPQGLGGLRLGMSAEEAIATGHLGPDAQQPRAYCESYEVYGGSGANATMNSGDGLMAITGGPSTRTPEGIGSGSTKDEVRAAYPNLQDQGSSATTAVPGNPNAVFSFQFSGEQGPVSQVRIATSAARCGS
ncbi:MAG: hypothetical protein GEU98_05145 [Pseudonocardiaceae bacterium]|nr:hypothetical protein [Pseudonocardiaceae bacterium]